MANLGAQLRDNPLPLLLISAGVGLMASRMIRNDGYQGGFGMYRDDDAGDLMRRSADPTAGFGNERDDYRSRASSSASGMMSGVRDTMSSVTDRVSSQVSSVTDRMSSQASSMRDTMRDAYSSSMDRMSDMTDRAGEYTNRARSGLSTLATEQPLVLGALGLLAGAALAAMLPRTQIEEEYVGTAAAQLRDQASNMASDTFERAKNAASKAAEVASQEFAAGSDDDSSSGGQGGSRQGSTGGPSQSGVSSPGGTSPSGAAALGVSSGSGGARPSETIAAGSSQGSSGGRS